MVMTGFTTDRCNRSSNRRVCASAGRLKQTIEKMEEIASGQTRDIHASIAAATRAAQAMETIAESLLANAESVRASVAITREIADRQKLITELQSRAYLTVGFDSLVPQNSETKVRFEPRMRLENRGNTPARSVRFSSWPMCCHSPCAMTLYSRSQPRCPDILGYWPGSI